MRVQSGQDPIVVNLPIYATADIADGALIMPGVTADTDLGLWIAGSGAAADAIGIKRGKLTYAATNRALVDGTQWVEFPVELFDRYSLVEVEYDQTDTMAVASNSSTTLTITSLEDNIDTSWIFNTTTGNKKLSFLVSSASGSATQKTAMSFTAADTVIKILRSGHQVAKLNSAATMIGTDAAAGTWTVVVLWNSFEAQGYPKQRLNPTLHDNLTLVNARFYATLLVRNTAGHTID